MLLEDVSYSESNFGPLGPSLSAEIYLTHETFCCAAVCSCHAGAALQHRQLRTLGASLTTELRRTGRAPAQLGLFTVDSIISLADFH